LFFLLVLAFVLTLAACPLPFWHNTLASSPLAFHPSHSTLAIYYSSVEDPSPTVAPMYYAMWVVSMAIRGDAVIVDAQVTTPNPLIKAWALRRSDGSHSILLIHKVSRVFLGFYG
jgi:hypothetical protein